MKAGLSDKAVVLGSFLKKLLKVQGEDRVHFGDGFKDTPGQDGRLIELDGELGSRGEQLKTPFFVDVDNLGNLLVRINGGTVVYHDKEDKQKVWIPPAEEIRLGNLSDGYVWLEYLHEDRKFEFKTGSSIPEEYVNGAHYAIISSTVVLAKIAEGRPVLWYSNTSFIMSPYYDDEEPKMAFACYHSMPT